MNPAYKVSLISFFILLLIAIPLLLLPNSASKKVVAPTHIPTPTAAPLTSDNADSTLTQEDVQIQSAINQLDTDLQQTNAIDTSQDTTAGL